MRPVNNERVVVEYVRIHRIVDPSLLAGTVDPFGDDLLGRLEAGLDLSGRWWKKEWRLGNVEGRRNADAVTAVTAVTAQFGWFGEALTVDAPPPYDERRHQWSTEPAKRREGVLALIAVDVPSQIAAVTSLAGDVPVPGLCRALTDLLNQAEMQASADGGGVRARREWLVEPVDERGTFEAWVGDMDKVVRVSARFHLPNPRSQDDLEPVVTYLNEVGASSGAISASNPAGLDPYGHPIMRSAIAMQENDYGSITAEGELPSGDPDNFASKEHPTRDVYRLGDQDPDQLSLRGVAAVILRVLAQRLESGLR